MLNDDPIPTEVQGTLDQVLAQLQELGWMDPEWRWTRPVVVKVWPVKQSPDPDKVEILVSISEDKTQHREVCG